MKIVTRTCVVTRKVLDRSLMFRVVKDKNSNVTLDTTYQKEGFGAYITKNKDIINKGLETKALNKKLKTNISKEIYLEMLQELKDNI